MWKAPQTTREMLQRNVDDFPDRNALPSPSCQSGLWTYQTWEDLDRVTNKIAAGLDRIEVKKGQKIALMQNNCIECVCIYLAVHKIGAVFVPINTRFVEREVEYILENSDTEHLILGSEFMPIAERIKGRKKRLKTIICINKDNEITPDWALPINEITTKDGAAPDVSIAADDGADLIFTSGTTGNPKAVILTQANKVANGRMSGASLDQRRWHHTTVKLQSSFPFFTSAGVSTTTMGWLYYGYSLIMESKFDVISSLETIERERSNIYAAAPSMLIFMIDHPRFKEFDTSSIDKIIVGGSVMPEDISRRIFDIWPEVKIYNFYGLTEAGPGGSCLCLAKLRLKPTSQ